MKALLVLLAAAAPLAGQSADTTRPAGFETSRPANRDMELVRRVVLERSRSRDIAMVRSLTIKGDTAWATVWENPFAVERDSTGNWRQSTDHSERRYRLERPAGGTWVVKPTR